MMKDLRVFVFLKNVVYVDLGQLRCKTGVFIFLSDVYA